MRAADTIEKITISNPEYLTMHKKEIIVLLNIANDKELKWHLALTITRLHMKSIEFGNAWFVLTKWGKYKTNSRIERANSIQRLFELTEQETVLIQNLNLTLLETE